MAFAAAIQAFQEWLILPHPTPSVIALCVFPILQAFVGLGEALGDERGGGHVPTGKFADPRTGYYWQSRTAHTVVYLGGAVVSTVGMLAFQWWLAPNTPRLITAAAEHRPILVALLLTLHFMKRLMEVKFVHRYHNGMEASFALAALGSYAATAAQLLYFTYMAPQERYAGHLVPLPLLLMPVRGLPPKVPYYALLGFGVWLVGELGNGYHHFLLSSLRADGSPAYGVPRGGLFSLCWCPHYLFELIAWYGLVIATQHLQPLCVALGMTGYLCGKAWATRRWYRGKMGRAFPPRRAAIIPFIL